MRKPVFLAAIGGFTLAAVTWAVMGYRQTVRATATVPSEYSVSLLASSFTDAGHNNMSRYLYASLRDGSSAFVHEQLNRHGEMIQRERKLSFADGRFIQIHEPVRVMVVEQGRPGSPVRFLPPTRTAESNCEKGLGGKDISSTLNFRFAGSQQLNGIDAAHFVSTSGKPQIEQWFAPKFGCAMVGEVIRYEFAGADGNPRYGNQTKQLEWIQGEVDPSVFQLPQYEVVTEAQAQQRVQEYYRTCSNCQ